MGTNNFEASLVDAWLDLCATEFDPLHGHLVGSFIWGTPLPADFLSSAELVFAGVEARIAASSTGHLVGGKLTAADIVVAFSLLPFYRSGTDFDELLATKYPASYKFHCDILSNEKIVAVLESAGNGVGLPSAEQKQSDIAAAKALGEKFAAILAQKADE